MKKFVAATLAVMMLSGISSGAISPAAAAPYSVHPTVKVMIHHSKHWRQHLWCKTKWRHHHKVKVCIWVPDHR
jgi:hypothetical protein